MKNPLLVWLIGVFALALLQGCDSSHAEQAAATGDKAASQGKDSSMVRVHVFNSEGKLVGPIEMPKVVKDDKEWRKQLTAEQYAIARGKGTERAFCGTLLDNHTEGVYTCICCGLPLFSSDSKFNSGTGWPSFFQPIAKENVAEHSDESHGMVRTEILCARCDGHLGHVFEDGPRPTGLRFCLNSESLAFTPSDQLAKLADPAAATTQPAATQPAADQNKATAVFAGGCFWCTEAVFERVKGVTDVESGYAGGSAETANYKAVCGGDTGHAEAIRVTYDPSQVSYEQLLEFFFESHNPTQLNAQGPDSGTQYRSAIFYANEKEKEAAQAAIRKVDASKTYSKPVVTTLEPLKAFYPAEKYHQDYARQNPDQPYIRYNALPKVEKVQKKFPDRTTHGS